MHFWTLLSVNCYRVVSVVPRVVAALLHSGCSSGDDSIHGQIEVYFANRPMPHCGCSCGAGNGQQCGLRADIHVGVRDSDTKLTHVVCSQ